MKNIIAILLIILATETLAFDYTCVPQNDACGSKDPLGDLFNDCSKKTSEEQYLNGEVCSGDRMCADVAKMYDNCFLDKMEGRTKYEYVPVQRTCERIACHPTLLQKFKYR